MALSIRSRCVSDERVPDASRFLFSVQNKRMSSESPSIPVSLNVPIAVKPGATTTTAVVKEEHHHWKVYATIAVLGVAVGGVLAYLILTKKIRVPGLLGAVIEEEPEQKTAKRCPPTQQPSPVPPVAEAPHGSGKRWTPIESLR